MKRCCVRWKRKELVWLPIPEEDRRSGFDHTERGFPAEKYHGGNNRGKENKSNTYLTGWWMDAVN